MTWFGIAVTYIRFYHGFKLQGLDRGKLPYASALQPYAAYYAAVSTFLICMVSSSQKSQFKFKIQNWTVVQRMEGIPQGRMGHGYLHN